MNSHKRLLAALDRLEPHVRREVERALAKLKRRISEVKLVAALERGDAFNVLAQTGLKQPDILRILQPLQTAFDFGRQIALAELSTLPLLGPMAPNAAVRLAASLNRANPFAVQQANKFAADLVTRINPQSRQAIRTVITRAFNEGIPPVKAARLIRPVIGLTPRQATALSNYRADRIKAGKTGAELERLVQRKSDKFLNDRAKMIARTEVIRASVEGQLDIWRQMQAQGLLPPTALKKWDSTEDARRCVFCRDMDGQTALISQPFVSKEFGAVSGPPLHPNCRCAVVLEQISPRKSSSMTLTAEDIATKIKALEVRVKELELVVAEVKKTSALRAAIKKFFG